MLFKFPTSAKGLSSSEGLRLLDFFMVSLRFALENTATDGLNLEASHFLTCRCWASDYAWMLSAIVSQIKLLIIKVIKIDLIIDDSQEINNHKQHNS